MARKIDPKILELAAKYGDGTYPIRFLKRFLDDIFLIYTGSVKSLHDFLSELNTIHPSIKFTMNHTFIESVDPATSEKEPLLKRPVLSIFRHLLFNQKWKDNCGPL